MIKIILLMITCFLFSAYSIGRLEIDDDRTTNGCANSFKGD
jgi:hypothetical protein